MAQPAPEVGASRYEDGEMVEAGVAGAVVREALGAGALGEQKKRDGPGAEGGDAFGTVQHREAEDVDVVGEGAFEVGNGERK
jgi:hypothetical protein